MFKRKKKPISSIKLNLKQFDTPNKERIAVLEMLLWKYHIQGIPKPIFKRMVDNCFMVKKDDGFVWSDVTEEIGEVFNEIFNYK